MRCVILLIRVSQVHVLHSDPSQNCQGTQMNLKKNNCP